VLPKVGDSLVVAPQNIGQEVQFELHNQAVFLFVGIWNQACPIFLGCFCVSELPLTGCELVRMT
jgi:hypothetical protein